MQKQDRRASGVKRVPVQTLVEICGRVPEVPAFEAQSIEVSGRGMHWTPNPGRRRGRLG